MTEPQFLFNLNEGVESPESQDPQFAGRVQWDKDVLTEGRLTLHVSRLRTKDSGSYECEIHVTPDGTNSRRCWLNVTGTFVVNVTQTSYQAEENQDITLEWTFSTRRETSLRSISIVCEMFTEIRISVLFHLNEGVEFQESQDPQFAGRVQWDKDVLREGPSHFLSPDSGPKTLGFMCVTYSSNLMGGTLGDAGSTSLLLLSPHL
ncbi:hypothetical protein F7725_004936 [Dissostichus mawsoni]|uniref:Immunoglobulin V-set domain-containing protein n=1 Tax=Dissostichus mawsoni TaxID=36200 RepID=A0A7J5XK64_DISMA|nr:hypothetical protein F7725_004936 [Dissostichus mawsoni]